jgi:hypothetical protein
MDCVVCSGKALKPIEKNQTIIKCNRVQSSIHSSLSYLEMTSLATLPEHTEKDIVQAGSIFHGHVR